MAIDVVVEDNIATVVINRPEAMNSIDPETRIELRDAFSALSRDPAVRVIILTGAGDRAFCTGSDLKKTLHVPMNFAAQTLGDRESVETAGRSIETDKPTICAINGFAVGGGLELAMACDIRIAADTARLGLTEVRIGSIPGSGGTQRLPRLVGMSNALHLLMTGTLIDAAEALRIGLLSRVVPGSALRAEAMEIARQIAANAPLAVRAVKRLAHAGADMALEDALELEHAYFGLVRETEDRTEGRKAFAEKRPPNFTGR
jgi:E-phenylitaconyl-CoA hydratase